MNLVSTLPGRFLHGNNPDYVVGSDHPDQRYELYPEPIPVVAVAVAVGVNVRDSVLVIFAMHSDGYTFAYNGAYSPLCLDADCMVAGCTRKLALMVNT